MNDDAWQIVEQEFSKGTLKKDIADVLNQKGFKTSQGKDWTYQTILLEQKKRQAESEMKNFLQNEENEELHLDAERIHLRKDTDDAWKFVEKESAKGTKKNLIVEMLNLKGFRTRNGKEWTYQTLMLEQKRRKQEGEKQFKTKIAKKTSMPLLDDKDKYIIECLQFAEKQLQYQVIDVLNRSGKRTRKGKPWTFQTLLIELLKYGLEAEPSQQKVHSENWWEQNLTEFQGESRSKKDDPLDLFDIMGES